MPCVNHPEADVQSYCQNCGKPLCMNCVRATPEGRLLCETCLAAGPAAAGTSGPSGPAYWQAYAAPPRGANPAAAAVLGFIPGVGAMYNGQYFKGLIHVVVFFVLISITQSHPIFGIFIAAWILYQAFEAYHTAKARRDGQPLPDPFGLNEVGNWLNLGAAMRANIPGAQPVSNPVAPPPPAPGAPSGTGGWSTPAPAADPTQMPPDPQAYGAPYTGGTGYQAAPQPPYSAPYTGPYQDPYAGSYPPGATPPIPPFDPLGRPLRYRRQEPFWAFILIGLGVIFLMHSVGIFAHLFRFTWPLLLIGLGVWLIIRRVGSIQGGSK